MSLGVKSANVVLTQDCSLRCSYCFCGEKYKREMDDTTAFRVLDWLLQPDVSEPGARITVDFWGGEPLLRWDLIQKMVEYGNKKAPESGKKFGWNMTTNGVHLTPRRVREMQDLEISFMVSMDGTPDHHDRHRKLAAGGGSYDVIAQNIHNIRPLMKHMKVRMSVDPESGPRLDDCYRHLYEDLHFDFIASSPVFEADWTDDAIQAYMDGIHRTMRWYADQIRFGRRVDLKLFTSGMKTLLRGGNGAKGKSHFCGAGRTYLGIGVDGTIYPCHRFDPFEDNRPWQEKGHALGHVEVGITNHQFHKVFTEPISTDDVKKKSGMEKGAIVGGACYATNYGCTGDYHALPKLAVAEHEQVMKSCNWLYANMKQSRNFQRWVLNPIVGRRSNGQQNQQLAGLHKEIQGLKAMLLDMKRDRLKERVALYAKAILSNPESTPEELREAALALADVV